MPRRKGLFGIFDQISSRASRLAATILETVQAPAQAAKPAVSPPKTPAAPAQKASPPARKTKAAPPAKQASVKTEKLPKASRDTSGSVEASRQTQETQEPTEVVQARNEPRASRLLDAFLEKEEAKLTKPAKIERRGDLEDLLAQEQARVRPEPKPKPKPEPKPKPKPKPKPRPKVGRLEDLLAKEQAGFLERKLKPEKEPRPIEPLSEKQAARLAPRNPHVQGLLKQLSSLTQALDGLGYGQESREVLEKTVQPEIPKVPEVPELPLARVSPLPQVSEQIAKPQVQALEEKKPAPRKRGCPPNPEDGFGGGNLTLNSWMAQHGIADSRDICWPKAAGEPYPGRYIWGPLRDDGSGPWMWREAIVKAAEPKPPKEVLPPKPPPAPPAQPSEYDLEGAGFFVPFQRDPKEAYRFLMDAWHRAGVGQVRAVPMPGELDETGNPRGETLGTQRFDPIVRIEAKNLPGQLLVPQEAIQSEDAFLEFLSGWKVTGGVQLRVENMVLRGASRSVKRAWVPPAIRVTNMGGVQPYETKKKKSKG